MEIPVVDLRHDGAAEQFVAACRDIGFVSVVGHGIAPVRLAEIRDLLRRLFAVDDKTKARYQITSSNYRGFIPYGFFTPNRAEVNGTRPDLYQGFKLHWECPPDDPVATECDLYGPNRWVDDLPDMAHLIQSYWADAQRLADQLLIMLASPLGVDAEELLAWHRQPLTNMTLLHYPASSGASQGRAANTSGIHPHKDTNVLTLLHPDEVGGLQVRTSDHGWLEPRAPHDAIVVNVGEMLELWSGGRLRATPHRVVNTSGRDRYSFPFFVVPRHDVVVRPLKPCIDGFARTDMPVGELSSEVWRTNWPSELPSKAAFDLGALRR